MCNRVLFSCWYARGSSFEAGASQGLLSLLVLHKFPTLKFYHGNQTKQAVSEMKTFKTKIAAVVASWISDRHSLSYFRSRNHSVATVCFNSNRPTIWVEKSKIGFQDGGYGGHFGFPIDMILAFFSSTCQPVVTL